MAILRKWQSLRYPIRYLSNKATNKPAKDAMAILERKYKESLADNENLLRRQRHDITRAITKERMSMGRSMLHGLDTLEFALAAELDAIKDPNQMTLERFKSFYKGIEMAYIELQNGLEKFGIKPIAVKNGDRLDLKIHHPIKFDPNHPLSNSFVDRVVQKGYQLGEYVVRPTQVDVVSVKTDCIKTNK